MLVDNTLLAYRRIAMVTYSLHMGVDCQFCLKGDVIETQAEQSERTLKI